MNAIAGISQMTEIRPGCRYLSTWAFGAALLLAQAPAQTTVPSPANDAVIPISAGLCADMKRHHVLNPGAPVGCERLSLVRFGYVGFDERFRDDGQIVVMDAAADHVLQAFITLRIRKFPIASARLMNEFDGDDDASMDRNNTSAFNVRPITGGGAISLHAYALAIDVNPLQNPYLTRSSGTLAVSPKAGSAYVRREPIRPGMAEPILNVLADQGFPIWGGAWHEPIDYQHFQVSRKLAEQLAQSSPADARALFERHVQQYRDCRQKAGGDTDSARQSCAAAEP
ncbi:MAG TPA: M15 family metallopeptidase [Xanthobacteraceae bacterium]